MLNIIPRHIAKEFKSGRTGGSFAACVIHVDISGFTAMTEFLLSLGKEGAEVLSSALNRVMKSVIGAIYRRGGFVTGFAGDSLTGVFPVECRQAALSCAESVRKLFRKYGLLRTPEGNFSLSGKIGIASGMVTWGIVGADYRKAFYYRGNPIRLSATVTEECETGEIRTANHEDDVESVPADVSTDELFSSISGHTQNVSKRIASLFVPNKVLEYKMTGEFRDVASVFVSIDESQNTQSFDNYAGMMLDRVESMGGYFNTFDFSAFPPRFLVLFGAPVSFENNVRRAVDLAGSIRRLSQNPVSIGIGYGRVYAGSIGTSRRCTYTVLGNEINIAARLMEAAGEDEILLTEKAMEKVSTLFQIGHTGNLSLKGVSETVDAFVLSERVYGGRILRTQSDFVGRTSELNKLFDFIKPVLDGKSAGVAYIHGEAGIGKSRLAVEAVHRLGIEVNTIILECDKVLRTSLNPFVSYFREYFNQLSSHESEVNRSEFSRLLKELISACRKGDARSDSVLSELDRTESMLAALLGVAPEDSLYNQLEPEQRFENTLTAIKEFFKAISIQGPLVIIVEDLSWADPDTTRVLSALTRNISRFPIAIIVTSRKTEDDNLPMLVTGIDIPTENILLDMLHRESIIQIIEGTLGSRTGEDVISFIQGKADGNPFFVEQFCLFLKENGLIDFSYDFCTFTGSRIEVPESIRAVIIARLDRLSTKLRQLVQTAAVLGREFDIRVLSEMLKGVDIQYYLHDGEGKRIWSELSEIIYIFRHAIMRDAVYEMQLEERLKVLHGFAAKAMEKLYKDDVSRASDLAYHFDKADHAAEAMKYTGIAASCAEHDYRNEEAVSLYRRLLNYTGEEKRKLEIRSEIADILIRTGHLREAEGILRENISEAEKLNEMKSLSDSLLKLGIIAKIGGDMKKAENLMKRSLSVYSDLQQRQKKKEGISHITVHLIDLYMHLGNIDKAAEYAEQGLASVGESDDYLLKISVLMSTASVQWAKSDFDGSYESVTEALRLARQENNLSAMVSPIGRLGNCCWRKGRISEAEQHYKDQLELALKVGYRHKVGSALNNLGNIYHIQGKYSKSMDCYSRRLEIADEMGDLRGIASASGNIGALLFSQGMHQEAELHFEKMLRICREIGYKKGESIATGNLTAVFLDSQDFEKSMECAKRKLDISEQIEDKQGVAQAYGLLGSVALELEDYDQARGYFLLKLKKSMELADKKGSAYSNMDLGDIARIQGDCGAASKYLDTAIGLLRELGAKNLLPDCLLLRAGIAYDLEKYEEATGFADEALVLAEEMDHQEILFNVNLLKASITAYTSDTSMDISMLEKMLSDEDTEEYLAALHCRIYRITGDELHRRKALDLYTSLNSKKSTRDLREKIEILSSGG